MSKKIETTTPNNLPALPKLNDAQMRILNGTTPKEYIKSRPGRGGKSFSYVEVGYVISQLNQAFGLAWDWEIITEQLGKRQVWVKGKLTIYFNEDFKVTKTSYGGSDIKTLSNGDAVDIADDLKAASSDALKKAASMIGIASDVYFPQLDRLVGAIEIADPTEDFPTRDVSEFPRNVDEDIISAAEGLEI